jgi:hypothetical protein
MSENTSSGTKRQGVLLKLFPYELRIRTPPSEQPTSTKISWGLFPFDCQHHPIYLQLKYHISIFYFCLPLNLSFMTSPLFCVIILLHGIVDAKYFFLHNVQQHFLYDAHQTQVLQINTIWSKDYSCHIHSAHLTCMTHNA